MNDDNETLKTLLQYYRNKCAQLEFDFVLYKVQVESKSRGANSISDPSNAREESVSDAKDIK